MRHMQLVINSPGYQNDNATFQSHINRTTTTSIRACTAGVQQVRRPIQIDIRNFIDTVYQLISIICPYNIAQLIIRSYLTIM